MSARRKHRPRSSRRQMGGAGFQVIVAAHPGSDIRLGSELELVKAGLLYGDAVTLLSPITTMLLRVEGLGRFRHTR